MRILLVGAGALGSEILRAVDRMPEVEHVLVLDEDAERAERAVAGLAKARVVAAFEDALRASDLLVEAASQAAVAAYAPPALAAGRDVVVLSIGALADDALRETLVGLAREHRRRIYLPSGAIGGLDALKAAREGGLDEVRLTTAKPPASLPPGLPETPGRSTLYEGPAREAVRAFPKNVNVAAALSLAGVGFDLTRVAVVADPSLKENTHTIEARGAFGSFRMEVRNRPSAANPASSALAAFAAIALIRRLVSPLQVGT